MASASRSLVYKFRIRELKRALPPTTANTSSSHVVKNPFIPHLNQDTGCWIPPRYSLRRQAELIKKARLEGNLHLLPMGPKLKLSEIHAARQSQAVGGEKGKNREDKKGIDISAPVEWLGEVKVREPTGAHVGNRLYAGKKQMFKGHKWERVIRRRRKYQRILMRDMSKRIRRWRQRRIRRKPWPLSSPRVSTRDSQKLPF